MKFYLMLMFVIFTHTATAQQFDVILKSEDEQIRTIGHISKQGQTYVFERNEGAFKDFFLSMKEMKCLEGPEIWCHVPYPYKKENVTSENALHWLSHDLLFMYKKSDQFGAQMRQGVIFALSQTNQGWQGLAYHVDLDELAAPPDDLSQPPIHFSELEQLETNGRWLPFLSIIKKH